MMTDMIDLLTGPDAIPWSQHERSDGDPDDLDIKVEDDGDREVIDAIPAPGPVQRGMPTTEGTDRPPF